MADKKIRNNKQPFKNGFQSRSLGVALLIILSSCYPLFAMGGSSTSSSFFIEEQLDQFQELDSYEESLHARIILAQSFVPSKNPLTRVEMKVNKPRITHAGLILSIRNDLNGSDLTAASISGDNVPFFINWVEFDIPDIEVVVGDTYYLVLRSGTSSENPYRLRYEYNDSGDIYSNGELFRFFTTSSIWEPIGSETEFVDACFRTYSFVPQTDMICDDLMYINESAWLNATPGQENLQAFFSIRNSGTPFSTIDWKIVNWPSWGDWSFSAMNGSNLRPEDGYEQINIVVTAPNINVPDEYNGKIIVQNENDENDTEEVLARLVTPKEKQKQHTFSTSSPLLSFFASLIQRDIFLFKNFFTFFS